MKNHLMSKTCDPERKRPEYKPKPKKKIYEVKDKEHEIHFFMEIPYILIGWPGSEAVYAVDDSGIIDYALTRQLRELMEEYEEEFPENLNLSEETPV